MSKRDLRLTPTVGLVGGLTIQFAEGSWPEEIGRGLALHFDTFADLIAPHVLRTCPGWTYAHCCGVFELSPDGLRALVAALRAQEQRFQRSSNGRAKSRLYRNVADWLEVRRDAGQVASILGA